LHYPLVFFSAVLVLGIAAQWLAWRLRLPSILILLAVGFLVGFFSGDHPDLPGDTISDEIITTRLLFPLVSMAVGVIMFEGGLTLRFHELADGGNVVFRLVSLAVAVTWALASLAAFYLLGMNWKIAALQGAILVVTGPTVIGPLLRQIRPSRRVGSVLKWEGIVIDPVGAVLTVLVFDALFIGGTLGRVVWGLTEILLIGTAFGLGTAWVLVKLMQRYWIPDFLHNPVFLAAAIGMFAVSNLLAPEAGLLTVTIMGIALANQKHVAVRHVLEFKENLRVLLISCLFVVLGARIKIEDISQLGFSGLAFVAILIFVIRPVSVMVATIGTELNWRERLFLGFLAPRGIVAAAVSSVFSLEVARYLGAEDVLPGQEQIVPITFLVIVVTVAFYGLAGAPLARVLGLAAANPQGILFAGAALWVRRIAKAVHEEGITVMLVDTNYRNIAAARMEGLAGRCASVVSEYMEEVDLGGIGRLFAMTPNDDLNTLAAVEFTPLFSRANVYQLSYKENAPGRRDGGHTHMSGRYLFHKEATYSNLAYRMAAGATIKKTKITEEFTYEAFRKRHGDSALLLFVITTNKQLLVSAADEPLKPKPGQTVIALVDPPREDNMSA
jgi:NhaP-type Na+/H+ or K+/H+ antiporter